MPGSTPKSDRRGGRDQRRLASTGDESVQMEIDLGEVVDALPGLVWTLDPDGRSDFVNRSWCDYTGLEPARAIADGWQAAIHPEDLQAFLQSWTAICNADGPGEIEGRLRRFDGEYRWFAFRFAALAEIQGRIARWCCLALDMTELRLGEQALSRARAELAHVARITTLGALTASMAHEVSQPLSGILNNANTCLRLLAVDPPNIAGAMETMRRTVRDTTRATDVITRLRALFARKAPAFEPVDLNDIAREVVTLVTSDLQRGEVSIRTVLDGALPPVRGDRIQLQQVILNLLVNATDAMATIEERPRVIVIQTWRAGDMALLSVSDVGVGIALELVETLFNAFYTTKIDGMGVGLSISRSIIESHEGQLWAAPNDGPGATFSFSIPCEPAL